MLKLLNILKNRYIIVTVIMLAWIVFFDRYNVSRRYRDTQELKQLEEERSYYKQKIDEVSKSKEELFSDQEKLEKFAREHYYMKKDNEDIFIVEK